MINCLIVDDDVIAICFKSFRESIQTHTFTSGEASLDFLENKNVDIAIVDIMMSGMDGFEFCQTLKDDYHIPVIMLTARDALSDKERAFLSGLTIMSLNL